jgi:hypothetical protein
MAFLKYILILGKKYLLLDERQRIISSFDFAYL